MPFAPGTTSMAPTMPSHSSRILAARPAALALAPQGTQYSIRMWCRSATSLIFNQHDPPRHHPGGGPRRARVLASVTKPPRHSCVTGGSGVTRVGVPFSQGGASPGRRSGAHARRGGAVCPRRGGALAHPVWCSQPSTLGFRIPGLGRDRSADAGWRRGGQHRGNATGCSSGRRAVPTLTLQGAPAAAQLVPSLR